ncbi:MAG: hypothetical protein E5Y79_34405 [Mesorhizobium sp.]|uniref:hypothetical protein n=1 Tax=Mesorhizobium sp. TaxID=1871066 RepID=UPI0012042BE9|nr:hypothetical protein [Mesorhizobium sp.]TIL55421.1 MAG: hypothetical protein E5Y79_34405 [Mesorhizobium sp.]
MAEPEPRQDGADRQALQKNHSEGIVIIDPAVGRLGRLKRGRWQWGGHEIAGVIHATHLHGSPAKNGGPVPESSRRRGFFAAVAASMSAVRPAKRAADEKPCVRRAGLMVQPEIRLLNEP